MEKKVKKHFSIFIFLLAAIFIAVSFHYVQNIQALLEDETELHALEVSRQAASAIEAKLNKNIELLHLLSAGIVSDSSIAIEEKMKRLENIDERFQFLRIGYAELDGHAITTDGYAFSVADRDYFKRSLNGEECISKPLTDKIGQHNSIIVYSVPVIENDTIIAVLFATYDLDKLADIVSIPFFGGSGYTYIIDNSGGVVFQSENAEPADDIYAILEAKNAEDLPHLKEAVATETESIFHMTVQGEDCCVSYEPIRKISNWNLVTVVSTDVIAQQSAIIIRNTVVMLVVLFLLFACILFYNMRMKRKNDIQVQKLAFIDNLTGIRNYNKFFMDCNSKLDTRGSKSYAVIYFDIDNFKMINDTFGYDYGDNLLRLVANLIDSVCGQNDIFGRLSNDYFGIMTEYKNDLDLIKMLNQIKNKINTTLGQYQSKMEVILSAGIYVIPPEEKDLNTAINKANMARGTIKGQHHKYYAFYNENIRNRLSDEKKIEGDIIEALKENQFEIYYHAKYGVKSEKMAGMEALIRWRHPERGFISPDEFIPVAEKCGSIISIGRWVLRTVCRDMQNWQKEGLPLLPVSVNLSRVELYQSNLIETVIHTIRSYDIPFDKIELELTESAALSDLEYISNIMRGFKQYGIKISMDDFGTGFSSLSCLRSIPIDILKLDRSFMLDIETDEKSRSILKAIITLAKSLGLTVVAEGVETKEQRDFLREVGCDLIQGYFYAKPEPKTAIDCALHNAI